MKKLIVHADDLGLNRCFNQGILEAYQYGALSSTCIRVNGTAYEQAVQEILPQCPHLGIGLHLNIVEGPSKRTCDFRDSLICDSVGNFNQGFGYLLANQNNARVIQEIKDDFRQQIEEFLEVSSIDHLNSHQHSHGIPGIFKVVCELAEEYGISYIRIPKEAFYFSLARMDIWALARCYTNPLKHVLLNYFSRKNRKVLDSLGLLSNTDFVGVMYTEIMSKNTFLGGIQKAKGDLVEVLCHPCAMHLDQREAFHPTVRDYTLNKFRVMEKELLLDPSLPEAIKGLGYEITNYRCLKEKLAFEKLEPMPLKVSSQPRLRAFLMMDETPFHHPNYTYRLIHECEHIEVVGASVVSLPNGGLLQKYLLDNWKHLGLLQILKLALSKYKIFFRSKLIGLLDPSVRFSVQEVLREAGVPFKVVSKANTEEHVQHIKNLETDVLISSNSLILKEEMLKSARLMCINRHSSLLPEGGGILPAFRAIQNRDPYFGVTIHKMEEQIDGGDILCQYIFPIEEGDSLSTLYAHAFFLSYYATEHALKKLRDSENKRDVFIKKIEGDLNYYSYPTEKDWREFHANNGRFI